MSSSQVGQDMEGSEGTSTVFGLLIKLLQDGWRERGFATKTGRLPPYTPGGERILVYHTGSPNVSRLYLECLWSAEELFSKGVREIHHFQSEMYYRTLMDCEVHQSARVRPNLQVDAYRELLGMKPRRPRAGRGHGSAMAAIEDEGSGVPRGCFSVIGFCTCVWVSSSVLLLYNSGLP